MKLAPFSPLAHRPRPGRSRNIPGLILLALASLVLLPRAQGQLVFPTSHEQLFFENAETVISPAGGHGQVKAEPGELWPEGGYTRVPRVAIVGAGAAGSSAAYFLNHFAQLAQLGLETEVTVYERNDYIGGRSTVIWPWNDEPTRPVATSTSFTSEYFSSDNQGQAEEDPVELGASIFVPVNKNLEKAAAVFNLPKVPHGTSGKEEDGTMAIYDGQKFVFTEGHGWGWWDLGKLFWKYGRAPLRVRALVKTTVQSFLDIYAQGFASFGPFESWGELARAVNLSHPAALTGADYFRSKDVGEGFVNELVAAATQVNYGTPVHEIHGLGALVSLAASGASAIKEGNRRIFEEFLARSGAGFRLNATVEAVTRVDATEAGKRDEWLVWSSAGNATYDAVILTAPFHQTDIRFGNTHAPELVPPQRYVQLFVTFVLTSAPAPKPEYFNLPPGTKQMPTSIFGTFDTASPVKPAFNSLNYIKQLSPEVAARFTQRLSEDGGDWANGTEWHVVKMFSNASLSEELLVDIFGEGKVGKTVEKVWLSYPHLDPVTWEGEVADVRLDEGLYYVNGFERFISTMETSTVAAFNVVSLLLSDFFGYTSPASWAEWEEAEA